MAKVEITHIVVPSHPSAWNNGTSKLEVAMVQSFHLITTSVGQWILCISTLIYSNEMILEHEVFRASVLRLNWIIAETTGITSSYPQAGTGVSRRFFPEEVIDVPRKLNIKNQGYTCDRLGSTVPFALPVSGVPSPLVLFAGSLVISVECFVSVFERPSCLPLCVFLPPAGFEVAA